MSQFEYETVLSRCEAGVRTLTLNRPQSLNAMNRCLIDELAQAFDDANRDTETRVIVLTGAGRAFCAGDDRKAHVHPNDEAEARDLVDAIQRVTRAMVLGEKPVIGAINGWAVGGGFEWAINCDLSIWARSARAFFPEVSLNLFVTGAVTAILPAMVGLVRAREMLYLGRQYDAAELKSIGLAWQVVDDDNLIAACDEVAADLAALPPRSLRDMKRVLNRCAVEDIEKALGLETEATVAGFLDPETSRRLLDF
jgi:enoyl-CoA hydratase/carnithine racemase